MSLKCHICKKNCKDGLSCDICGQISHPNCAGVSPQEAECLKSTAGKIRYFCEKCNIVDVVSNLQQELNQLKNELSEMKNQISKQSADNAVVNAKSDSDKQFIDEEIITEMLDRQERANNLIIYNLPEPDHGLGDRRDNDLTNVGKIVGIAENSIVKCVRLKRKNDNDTVNPLLVRLNSSDDVLKVLKSYRTRDNIYVNRDLTVRQRNMAYLIRKEFGGRKEGGEVDIKLKYINGMPKIVKTALGINSRKN
ncbi:hypothetical protein Zmor_001627 [Zophobas morio]|uniref:Phorbol-ester/DAG-type domain-containing protein n=1 Tax=Zophobas morio TaxID=2755281 RepID=A0AA38MSK6_9CUCU|nr:hypothetical protein Zmor_001627 [Zophobas morio]